MSQRVSERQFCLMIRSLVRDVCERQLAFDVMCEGRVDDVSSSFPDVDVDALVKRDPNTPVDVLESLADTEQFSPQTRAYKQLHARLELDSRLKGARN